MGLYVHIVSFLGFIISVSILVASDVLFVFLPLPHSVATPVATRQKNYQGKTQCARVASKLHPFHNLPPTQGTYLVGGYSFVIVTLLLEIFFIKKKF